MPRDRSVPAVSQPSHRWRTQRIDPTLARLVRTKMRQTGTPGVAVGVFHRGRAFASGFGITSVEAPTPVDESTLFQIGSTTKTFTASAIMRQVDRGLLDLDVPVRRYIGPVPLRDRDVAHRVTLRHLLTHRGGWAGDFFEDTGRGDDALAHVVSLMGKTPQLTSLGSSYHYNNSGFYIAGRVLETITGQPYEDAIRELLLQPLEMSRSFFFAEDAIPYRVAAGHDAHGPRSTRQAIARPWAPERNVAPAGGLISTSVDQLRWARFHMDDGRAPSGRRLLKRPTIRAMQREQASAGGFARSVGIAWFLNEYDGVQLVQHGGSVNGQESAFVMVPAQGFAVTVLTNSNRGIEVHRPVVRAALAMYLGVEEPWPEPVKGVPLRAYEGRYLDAFKEGAIDASARIDHLRATVQLDEGGATQSIRLAPLGSDTFLIQSGVYAGYKVEFLFDDRNRVRWMRFGGRLYRRTPRR